MKLKTRIQIQIIFLALFLILLIAMIPSATVTSTHPYYVYYQTNPPIPAHIFILAGFVVGIFAMTIVDLYKWVIKKMR